MVLFKRGFAGTIAEWLAATDYITMEGNDNVVLCERGLRTFETATRFTLDLSAVPVIHKQSLLPICSGRGRRLHHDRGAPQPAGGAFRRPAAADPGAVPRPGRGAARNRRGVREEDRLAVAKRFA